MKSEILSVHLLAPMQDSKGFLAGSRACRGAGNKKEEGEQNYDYNHS